VLTKKKGRCGFGRGAFIFGLLVILLAAACGPKPDDPVSIIWTDGKATGLILRQLHHREIDLQLLEVRLANESEGQPMLGTFRISGDVVEFTPVVPFTKGLTYNLLEDGNVLREIAIPVSDSPAPVIVAIYPTADTVPENLLKVYLKFSAPMMEGRSASFVRLLKDGRDTMKGTFLDLQPELWNEAGTILTLWLDPGRIKLDLIPNKEMGNPLTKGARYEIVVTSGWKSMEGKELPVAARKRFFVGSRDDESPDIAAWEMELPAAGSRQPLRVNFLEPLDRMLAEEALKVLDAARQPVSGKYAIIGDDSSLEFLPDSRWLQGDYLLSVQARMEDLSGNNLYRLFETDLSKSDVKREKKDVYERSFSLK